MTIHVIFVRTSKTIFPSKVYEFKETLFFNANKLYSLNMNTKLNTSKANKQKHLEFIPREDTKIYHYIVWNIITLLINK